MTQHFFNQTELDRIAEAVRVAESKTSGEIVPYFVEQSDDYSVAHWRSGVIFASLAMLATLIIHSMSTTWSPLGFMELSGIVVAAFLLGILLSRAFPAYHRILISHSMIEHRVNQRASLAFLSEEVFKTRERTGILIFLSFFEQRVVVMGDSGINAHVEKSSWDGVVKTIVESIHQNKPTDGLVKAIQQCGDLLQQHGVVRRRDDTDELSDSLRVG